MTKLKTTLFLSALVALLLAACSGGKDRITIEGTLAGGAGKTIFIEEMSPDARIFLDSITLDKKGHFKFTYDMPYKTFYNVHVSNEDYVVLLPDEGTTVEMSGSYDSLSLTYRIQGNKDSQLLWQLQDYTNNGTRALRALVTTDRQNAQRLEQGEISQQQFDIAHNHTDSVYLATFSEQQQYVVRFIEDNLGSLATLIALYKPFNGRQLINPEDSFEFYEGVLEGLESSLPDNPHTLSFKNQVERTRFQYARQ